MDTAGGEVVGRLTQQIATASAATLIGEGKVEELGKLVFETKATLVVFDEELSPAQGQGVEEAINTRVEVGVDNVFDKQPPDLYTNNSLNANTDPADFDVLGRYYWTRATVSF